MYPSSLITTSPSHRSHRHHHNPSLYIPPYMIITTKMLMYVQAKERQGDTNITKGPAVAH